MKALKEKHPRVTPFVGVWIETRCRHIPSLRGRVTPFVGVWIETQRYQVNSLCTLSHTLRGCVD